jgi:predicted AAA+ superfamily ATPase
VYALDRPGVLEIASADPDRLITGTPPILIDEWQRFAQSWDLVRRAVDREAVPGRFLLASSATPRDPGTHSGAGRIVRTRIDFIIERGDHRVLAVEVKLAYDVGERDARHLHWLAQQAGDDLIDAIILTTGAEAYRRADGVGVIPAVLLGP